MRRETFDYLRGVAALCLVIAIASLLVGAAYALLSKGIDR
jgi:hypothetical protein